MSASVSDDIFGESLNDLIDELHRARLWRKAADDYAAECKTVELEAQKVLLEMFADQEIEGAMSGGVKATIDRKTHYSVDPQEFDRFWEFVKQEDAFDMFERRYSNKAFKDRIDQGVEIPGVRDYTTTTIKTSPIKKR